MLAVSDRLFKKVVVINTNYPLHVAELSTSYLEITANTYTFDMP